MSGVSPLSRYRTLFREQRDFRIFWPAFAASAGADEVARVALIWFVFEKTGSAAAVGWLLFCFSAPVIVGGFLAGWALDRFDRRGVMIADNVARAFVVLAIPALHVAGALEVWHVFAAAVAVGLLQMIPHAGAPAIIPSLVPHDRLQTANALEMLAFTLGAALGPALGGVLIAWWGAPFAVLVNGVVYLWFALALARLRPQRAAEEPTQHAATTAPLPARRGFAGVFALLVGNPILLSTTLMFLVFNIGLGLLLVWLPVLAEQRLDGGATGYGLLLGTFAAGQMISALVIGGLAPGGRLGLRIALAQASAGALLLLALPMRDVAAMAALLLACGLFVSPLTIWAQTLRMAIVPPAQRGRAFATLRTIMQGGRPIGGAIAGVAVGAWGIDGAILLSAALIGLPGLAGLLVRGLREARPPAPPPASP